MKKLVNNILKANRLFILLFFLFVFCSNKLLAQNQQSTCTITLRNARNIFNEGKVHEIESLVIPCINNGFNEKEMTEAYRLLILSYIYLDDLKKANDAMLALLKFNHGYEVNNEADPTELIHLYNTFSHDPLFFWGMNFEFNQTIVNILKSYSVSDLNTSLARYNVKSGISIGTNIKKKIYKRFSIKSCLNYSNNNFEYVSPFFNKSDDNSRIIELSAMENLNSFGISSQILFELFRKSKNNERKLIKKYNPYIGIGASYNFITKSELIFDITNKLGRSPEGPSENLITREIRKTTNPSIEIEIGGSIPIDLSYFNFGIKYRYGINNLTDKNYDPGKLSTFYGWAANDIKLNSISLFIEILIPKYSPKKLTK